MALSKAMYAVIGMIVGTTGGYVVLRSHINGLKKRIEWYEQSIKKLREDKGAK